MKKKYSLIDAQNFVRRFQKTNDLAEVLNNFDSLKQSIKIFADKNDEDNFWKINDKYFELIKTDGKKEMKKDAYRLLEVLCYDVDNRFMERKGKAVRLFEKYLRKIEIRYNTESYSQVEVYEKVNSLSDGLVSQYSRRVSNSKKKWNNKKDTMKFKFKSRGFDIGGNIKLGGDELVIDAQIPLAAKLYREEIAKKIRERLEKVFPKLSVSK